MASSERAQWARLDLDGVAVLADLAAGVSLARALHFEAAQLRCFDAPPATSVPLRLGHSNARVSEGASCNASIVSFAPHVHGTHTECVGHLTVEPVAAWRLIPQRLLVTVLMSLRPTPAATSADTSQPAAQSTDALLTRAALLAAWPAAPAERLGARAAVIRTLPNDPDKFSDAAAAGSAMPPYLSLQATRELVARGIAHLVLDLPSADRLQDGGALSAHRLFFGLPSGGTQLAQAQRPECTLTELAYIEDGVPDGWYLLSLQAPCIDGDAVPSRPVLYPLRVA